MPDDTAIRKSIWIIFVDLYLAGAKYRLQDLDACTVVSLMDIFNWKDVKSVKNSILCYLLKVTFQPFFPRPDVGEYVDLIPSIRHEIPEVFKFLLLPIPTELCREDQCRALGFALLDQMF